MPLLIGDRLSLTKEGKSQLKTCLHPHLEQGGPSLVENGTGCHFFFFVCYLKLRLSSSRTTFSKCILKKKKMYFEKLG